MKSHIAKTTWIDLTRRKTVLSQILKREQPKVTIMPDHGLYEIDTAFQALMKHLSPLQRTVFLRVLAASYERGDIARVVELIQLDEADAAAV